MKRKWMFFLMLGMGLFLVTCAVAQSYGSQKKGPWESYDEVKSQIVKSRNDISRETDRQIKNTIRIIQEGMIDVDGDNKTDCCDHSMLFHLVWTTYVDTDPDHCLIVHTVNPGKMNHLFCMVKDLKTGKWIEVEPFTHNLSCYLETECWQPGHYNPYGNRYDESDYWASTVTKPVILLKVYR